MTAFTRATICSAVLALAVPPIARAQQTVPDASGSSGQAPQSTGSLVLEKVKSGFVAAPDFKATELDDEFGTLVGGYLGWLSDETWLVGGAGYWLANGSDTRKMAYGGLLVGWTFNGSGRIAFGARGLVGGGQATLADSYPFRVPAGPPRQRLDLDGGSRSGSSSELLRYIVFDQAFFIAEPQGHVAIRLLDNVHLDWTVGYRLIGAEYGFDDRLRGITGSVAVRFGGGR